MLDLEQIGAPAFYVSVQADGSFRYLALNAAAQARTGLSAARVIGRTPYQVHDVATADRLCAHYRQSASDRRMIEYDVQGEMSSGHLGWHTSLLPVFAANGDVDVLLGIVLETSPQKRLEHDLRAANDQLDLAIRMLKGAAWRCYPGTGAFEASPHFALLMGEEHPRHVVWQEWADRVLVQDRSVISCDLLSSSCQDEQTVYFRYYGKNGDVRWARCRRVVAEDELLTPIICGVVVDVTDEHEHAMALEIGACRDSLTNLLNRRGFEQAAAKIRGSTALAQPFLALLMLDLDDFKEVNDRFGHAAGDDVLIEIGVRLTTSLGRDAVIARFGGDEFAAVVPGVSRAEAMKLQHRLIEALGAPHRVHGANFEISGSVGLSWRRDESDLAVMMAEADHRLYRNKRNRKAAASRHSPWGTPSNQMSLFAA